VSESLSAIAAGYGITQTGFARMRLPEIRSMIIDDLQARTGLLFDTRTDSISGQFIDTFAEREAALWELAEAVYHAMFPISAFGSNLDHAVSFAGVRRLFESRSKVFAVLYGVEGTVVTAGALVRQVQTRASLALDADTTITAAAVIDATVIIENVAVGNVYTVLIDGVAYSVTAGLVDDAFTLTAALAIALNVARPAVSTDANTIRLTVLEFSPFALAVAGNIRITVLGSGGNFTSEVYGPLELPPGTVTLIATTQTGWDAVNNLLPGSTGRSDEPDDALRRRYDTGVFRLGAGTVDSIDANLRQNIPGLLALRVFENVEDFVDADNRVPHCIEVVIEGGDAQVIGRELWLLKAAGIDSYGNEPVTVLDSRGYAHVLNYNRPVPVYLWVLCGVALYDEEIFPADGTAQVQRSIVATGNAFGIGVDVIIQRFHGPIYAAVPGIENLAISIAALADPAAVPLPGDYATLTAPIADRALSRFDASRVVVTVLP
jgi:uncharacterized phage protein gp47/JayE